MIKDLAQLRAIVRLIFPTDAPPKPLHLLDVPSLVQSGALTPAQAAAQFHTTRRRVTALVDAIDLEIELLGEHIPALTDKLNNSVRQSLGQLLLGDVAEKAFEDIYRMSVGTTELQLRDDRSARGDTDYLVYDGQQRQVFRINIKFHGSLFRRARDLVGLDPSDCFALATYKINAALHKQDSEHLPYLFIIVGVPGLTGAVVGESVPEDIVHFASLPRAMARVEGIRNIEDHIVQRITGDPALFGMDVALERYSRQIRSADWYELSARRADALLRKNLFERAYALRVRNFARNYRGAELDMHYSLSEDLRPLSEFLEVLREHGMPGLVSRLERGTL